MSQGYRGKRHEIRWAFGTPISGFSKQASRRLARLDAATTLADLRGLPSNRLEAVRGDRAGQFSIRINDHWRVCFEWPADAPGPLNVEIVDDHSGTQYMRKRPVNPGEVLQGELEDLGITATELARQIEVPANRITQLIAGKRAVAGDTALRLGHWFRASAQFWLNLQAAHDLALAEKSVDKSIGKLPRRAA